jgi:hypothetical protein
MKKTKYQTRRVRSCFNRVIELNQKMLILKRFVARSVFYVMMTTEMCNTSVTSLWPFHAAKIRGVQP